MPGFSNAAELVVLDAIVGDAVTNLWGPPVYLALTTAAVGETDTSASLVEANYTGYARLAVGAADFAAAAAGQKQNSSQLTFANCTAGTSTIIGWALCNVAGTGAVGTVIMYGTCASTVISTTQTPATVAVNALTLQLD